MTAPTATPPLPPAIRIGRFVRRMLATLTIVALAVALLFLVWAAIRGRPQDLPWTPLDLGDPIGAATGRKLTGLRDDFPACEALMRRAGVRYTALPPRQDGATCGYDDGLRLTSGGARRIAFAPADLGIACPVAASLAMWEWNVVQPAAQELLGSAVTTIDHFGSYNCRRMYGREGSSWSEHATANAVDIAGFRLADGRRITLVGDWSGDDAEAQFLRTVRDGACRLFATTLSPDYNAAHRDHLHLDHAARGAIGGRACR